MFLDVTATLEGRRTLVDLVERIFRRFEHPVHRRRWCPLRRRRARAARGGRRQGRGQFRGVERPRLISELAEQLGAQAVVVAIDAEGGVVRSRAGTTDAGRDGGRLGARGRGERRGRDPADVDRRRRHARRLRPRADRCCRRRGRRAGDRLRRCRRGVTRRRSARGRAGCAACLDPAREPCTSSHAAQRAVGARG